MNGEDRPEAANAQRPKNGTTGPGVASRGGPTRGAEAQSSSRPTDEAAQLGPVPQYPVQALPDAAQVLVRSAEESGLPAALVGGAVLAAMSAAIGSASAVRVLCDQRAILWTALIAPAGAGKSPAQALAFGPLRAWDEQADDDDRVLLGDMTLEALARELDALGGAAGLDLDELVVLLRGIGEYKRSGGGDRGRFLSLWTGAPWSVSRVAGGARTNRLRLRVPKPTVVICGGLQSHLHDLLGSDEDGSRARWLPHLAGMAPTATAAPTSALPAAWCDLVTELLAARATDRHWWLDEAADRAFGHYRGEWKRQARGVETASVSTALLKADIHLARIALVLAEAKWPGGYGFIGAEIVEQAAAIVEFTLGCWRALPSNESLGLSRRDMALDRGVAKLAGWLEQRDDRSASRRDIQRARVGGARTPEEVDALIGRYRAIFPGSVTELRSGRGGPATVIVSAPLRARSWSVTSGDSGNGSHHNPTQHGGFGTVAAGDSYLATTGRSS